MDNITVPNNFPWQPIFEFRGHLDGNNYGIGINMASTSLFFKNGVYMGLFAINYGTIENLYMCGGMYSTYDAYFAGIFTGINYGTIRNVHASSYVYYSNSMYAGKIAGINHGLIEDCVSSGYITGNSNSSAFIGGIAGYNSETGEIINCSNIYLSIIGQGAVGGIVGLNSGIIDKCENTLGVGFYFGGENRAAGGIAGIQDGGIIKRSKNYGTIHYSGAQSSSLVLQPAMGQIVGHLISGDIYKNIPVGSVDRGTLQTVPGTNHNQALYVRNGPVGRRN